MNPKNFENPKTYIPNIINKIAEVIYSNPSIGNGYPVFRQDFGSFASLRLPSGRTACNAVKLLIQRWSSIVAESFQYPQLWTLAVPPSGKSTWGSLPLLCTDQRRNQQLSNERSNRIIQTVTHGSPKCHRRH
jgi:hypothetical protein